MQWREAVCDASVRAVKIVKAISFPGVWQDKNVSLTIDWKTGLWLNHETGGDV